MVSLSPSPLSFSLSLSSREKKEMPPSGILLHPLSASTLIRPSTSSAQYDRRRSLHKPFTCRASSSSSSSFSVTDFDLYDLLGIDSTSNQSQIKTAYRSLQKRCHPDIAGPTGHEMAIILNDVYAILSDPVSRSAYDEEQAKLAEFQGYSGKPLYSSWFGSESEERAVFVDEVRCVGCLKCALLAEKTFAIESVYGRARVVAQWADPEDKILDAMQACPVDCISMVERKNLAALEFLMSKQPRANVGNTPVKGMVDVKKFQSKLQQAKNRESVQDPRETAFHTIRSISNWFYWQSPDDGEYGRSLIHIEGKGSPFDTQKLREAAAAAKQGFWAASSGSRSRRYSGDSSGNKEDYWKPSPPPAVDRTNMKTSSSTELPKFRNRRRKDMVIEQDDGDPRSPMMRLIWSYPMGIAAMAATVVRLGGGGGGGGGGGYEQQVAGPLPLEIVNSSWLQAILAGCTWYIIGFIGVGLVKSFTNRHKM